MRLRLTILCAGALAAAACGSSSTAPTEQQNADLDRAAELLDQAPNSLDQVEDSGLAANAGEPDER